MNRYWKAGAVLMVLAMAGAVLAAEATSGPAKLGEGKGQVILSWDDFVKITGYDPAHKGTQTLTVPWAEVEKLLGTEIQIKPGLDKATVDLPWNEFKALLEWSVKVKAGKVEAPPPTDYVVTSSALAGTLSADSAEFTLTAKLDVLRKQGWKTIPILPSSVALTESKLPKGMYINNAGENYVLLTEESGAQEVVLKFVVAVQKAAGISRVSFVRPTLGSAQIDLTVAGEDAEVKVAAAQAMSSQVVNKTTAVKAAMPSGVPIDITWQRALPKVAAAPTKLYADTRTLVAVGAGVLLGDEVVNFNILHSPVRELKLQVPPGVSVLEVTGNNVQEWRADDKGVLTVALRAEAIGAYGLRLTYEQIIKDKVEAPVVRTVGVERESGFVGVVALTNVEITGGEVVGATAIDVRQLPGDILAMSNQPTLLAFRYSAEKFAIPLNIKKHEEITVLVTVVDSALYTGMQLNDGRRMTKVVFTVRNNRSQFLRVMPPEKAEIWSVSVSGATVAPAKDEKGNVLIPLVRSAAGERELASFPVEVVYVETPKDVAPAQGKLHVELPKLDQVPILHAMYEFYAPSEGAYTVPQGIFSSPKSGFTGPMRLVDAFASMSSGPGAEVIKVNAARQVVELQKAVDVKADQTARAAGVQPIRVQLPINGKLYRLEKILAMPGDNLFFDVQYANWKPAK